MESKKEKEKEKKKMLIPQLSLDSQLDPKQKHFQVDPYILSYPINPHIKYFTLKS
jgi:hypothetical protein